MELAETLPARRQAAGRFTFAQKPVAAAGFVAMADLLFYHQRMGSTAGLFCVALLAFLLITRSEILRHRPARLASVAAGALGLILVERSTMIGVALFWLAITLAVLLSRTARFDDGWRWTKRLARHLPKAVVAPYGDTVRSRRAIRRHSLGLGNSLPMLAVPLLGTVLFLALFARANPLIGNAFGRIDAGSLFGGIYVSRIVFWLGFLILIWSLLRPPPLSSRLADAPDEAVRAIAGITVASVTLSLIAFNAVFALQNALDLAFLWSAAPLPEGLNLAEYAHRGAYPLIATALLAGLFVLVTLRPGSAMAENQLIRRLVYVWIGQNVFLVASTMLRTFAYIDAYSLTVLRISALIWMALVALGLMLICYRIWRRRSGAWLINANLAAALIALGACSIVDLGNVAARWNLGHAREVDGGGAYLDLAYLHQLGASALLPAIELETRTRNPVLKRDLAWVRIDTMRRLSEDQADWHGWTFRNARRLRAAEAEVKRHALPRTYSRLPRMDSGPPRVEVVPPPPLTAEGSR